MAEAEDPEDEVDEEEEDDEDTETLGDEELKNTKSVQVPKCIQKRESVGIITHLGKLISAP